jgi:methionine aminotransferase
MSKFPQNTPSIFSTMSQMAKDYNAINLSQGFPNFPVDERLKELVAYWAKKEVHQYQPMAGFPPLLEKLAHLTQQSYNRTIQPEKNILITAGATEGIFASLQALVQPNEEVVILDPSYDCYETPILLCNAKPVRVNMNLDFTPDWERIGNAINRNTKIIIINTPHNPSGKVWKESDFIQLELLMELHPKLLVLSDEVYEYITFENPHLSINQREKIRNRSICISSFGKSFHITGWKIGYIIAPETLMNEIKKVHQFLVFSVNSIAQYAINDYIDKVHISELGNFYKQKRDYFRNLLKETKFELLDCEGSYFQIASYSRISKENDMDFAMRLVKDYGVATIPLSPFYKDSTQTHCLRFCFAKEENTLIEATKRLQKI